MDVLREKVRANNDLMTCTMLELREAFGAGKLGVHVRKGISDALHSAGLGHVPEELPTYQHEPVRVYRLGSPVAELITAVLRPSDAGDARLREAAGGDDARILQQIRQLVCDQ